MTYKPYPLMDGSIRCTGQYDAEGNVINVAFEWYGGDLIGMTEEFLNNLDERFVRRDGDIIQFGDYKVEICSKVSDVPGYGAMVYARRIYD